MNPVFQGSYPLVFIPEYLTEEWILDFGAELPKVFYLPLGAPDFYSYKHAENIKRRDYTRA